MTAGKVRWGEVQASIRALWRSRGLASLIVLLSVFIGSRIAWLAYTGYTAEDALITFRFARNLAGGFGFAYNAGEPVYGATTPLLTFLLAGLHALGLRDIFLAVRLIDLAASTAAIGWTAIVLLRLEWLRSSGILLLGVFAVSAKAIQMDTQGMEWPIVILLMAVSWDAYSRGRPAAAGVAGGLLLWTRIDGIVWVAALLAAFLLRDWRSAVRYSAIAFVLYLPWCVFAALSFDSIIPLTVIAKWVAFGSRQPSIVDRVGVELAYLSPLDYGVWLGRDFLFYPAQFTGGFVLYLAAALAWRWRGRMELWPWVIFAAVQLVGLVASGATYDFRYSYPLVWVVWIMAAVEVASAWGEQVRRHPARRWLLRAAAAGLVGLLFASSLPSVSIAKAVQHFRHEESLQAVGGWLREHTSPDAVILLEPLGYAGFYSERRMLDEVGIVTPQIIEWKAQGLTSDDYVFRLLPDYTVLHCDDGARLEETRGLGRWYARVAVFNPLQFDGRLPVDTIDDALARGSCYEIWRREGSTK